MDRSFIASSAKQGAATAGISLRVGGQRSQA